MPRPRASAEQDRGKACLSGPAAPLVLALALLSATPTPANAYAQEPEAPTGTVVGAARGECAEAEGRVEVKVQPVGHRIYHYTLRNRYSAPVRIFGLGLGSKREMWILDENIPRSVRSPEGWQGDSVFFDESPFMQIFWHAVEPDGAVATGTELGGFSVEMPDLPPDSGDLVFDGEQPVALDMEHAPFRVGFADGTCAWGHVTASQPLPRTGPNP